MGILFTKEHPQLLFDDLMAPNCLLLNIDFQKSYKLGFKAMLEG